MARRQSGTPPVEMPAREIHPVLRGQKALATGTGQGIDRSVS